MKNNAQFDVVIVGGGIVGSTLACALATSDISVAVIETRQVSLELPEQGFDLRVSAITQASQHIFSNIAAWNTMQALRVSPFSDMRVWDDSVIGNNEIHFDSAEIGKPYLGHIIENRVILSALYDQLAQNDNITVFCPTQIKRIHWHAEQVECLLENNSTLKTSLLVAADGSLSWLRQQAGISVRGWDYPQDALVSWVKTERSHQQTAWQRFTADGPLAFLPLLNGYSSIVWSTSPSHAHQLMDLSDAAFRSALGDAFSNRLGAVIDNGSRGRFPLRFFVSNHYVKPRLALIGDAAHTMHPLAGQGVNVGIADVSALAQVLSQARQQGQDLGAMPLLRRYERWRRAENLPMLATVDGFQRLFSSSQPAVMHARHNGMKLTQKLPFLKNIIMRQAMGI